MNLLLIQISVNAVDSLINGNPVLTPINNAAEMNMLEIGRAHV